LTIPVVDVFAVDRGYPVVVVFLWIAGGQRKEECAKKADFIVKIKIKR